VPTVLRSGPYRIYFVSHDLHEPPHVHVDRDDDSARPGDAPKYSFQASSNVRDVRFAEDVLIVDLLDGRTISVPLVWYPRLLSATPEQRTNWRLAGGGFGIHWPDVDEDLSTEGMLRGAPAPRGSTATGRTHSG
jgi:Protein of unknown function (DUF2442)/Domain of unknown function (DUF4160)